MFENLIKVLQSVAQGDGNALESTKMDQMEEGKPSKHNLSLMSLRAAHYRACNIKAAADVLGMATLSQMCQTQMNILNTLCEKCHEETLRSVVLDPDEYAETMVELVRQVDRRLVPLAKAFSSGDEDSSSPQNQTTDPSGKTPKSEQQNEDPDYLKSTDG